MKDDFFIGWLRPPMIYRCFLRRLAAGVLAGGLIVGGVVAMLQHDPGHSVWNMDPLQVVEGRLFTRPYPGLCEVTGRTWLLVEEGKHGAQVRVAELGGDGAVVRARGTALHRNGRWMLELAAGPAGLQVMGDAPPDGSLGSRGQVERITFHGEIIDPKCYLGAMKPGGGKTHKACAMLCIKGGIPPMLVTRDSEKRETYYLLADESGGPLDESILPFVGEQVAVTGRLEKIGDLLVLRIAAGGLQRE